MVSLYFDKSHITINNRLNDLSLLYDSFNLVENPIDADVIVAARLEDLQTHIFNFRINKKYLIWCDEPLWSNIFYLLDRSQIEFKLDDVSIKIHIMNCFTGDVLFSNHHFLTTRYNLDSLSYKQLIQKKSINFTSRRNVAAIFTYRTGSLWNYKNALGIHGLNSKRINLAIVGAAIGHVDLYGNNWPELIRGKNAFNDNGSFLSKINFLSNYKFNLCFENTWAPFYVTEKLWQSIISGCLPIYYAGPNHTIYKDFARNSFIDAFDFENPTDLFEYLSSISEEEFFHRLNLCEVALSNAIAESNSGIITEMCQFGYFQNKIQFIMGT
jgi:hypothetical protein